MVQTLSGVPIWGHIVAVGDGAVVHLQTYGVHGLNVGVSASFQAVLQGGRTTVVAPPPEASDVVG